MVLRRMTDAMMQRGMTCSALLHIAVFLLALLGLPHLMQRPPEIEEPITVELVPIAPKTTPPKAEPKPEPVKKVEPAPPAPPLPELPKPPEPKKAEVAPPQPPEPPKPTPPEPPKPAPPPVAAAQPVPEPEPVPKPKPEKKAEVEPKPAPPPIVQEPPKAKPKPVPDTTLESILKSVEKIKPRAQPDKADEVIKNLAQASKPSLPSALDTQMTMSEQDALKRQIERCWSPPAGAKEAKDLRIEIRVSLNPDGSVQGEPSIVDQARYGSDGYFKAAADSARRAVLLCQPYRVPPEKYAAWRDLVLTFDPSHLL